MRTTGLVVVVVVVGSGCFSTARYDDAHLRRVASINARYAAESQRVAEQYASLVAVLDEERRDLIPMAPGPDAPVSRIDEREDIVRHTLDAQIKALAQQRAQAQGRLARERQSEIRASEQQRTSEIASGRAVRRARLQAAADAATPTGQGSISARQRDVAAIDDQLLSHVGGCPTGDGPSSARR